MRYATCCFQTAAIACFDDEMRPAANNILSLPVDSYPSNSGPHEKEAWLQRQVEELHLVRKHEPEVREALAQILAAAISMERQRFLHTMQDTVVQSLTAVYFTIKVIETNLRRSGSEVPEGVVLLEKLIDRTSAELHEVIKGLQPVAAAVTPP